MPFDSLCLDSELSEFIYYDQLPRLTKTPD